MTNNINTSRNTYSFFYLFLAVGVPQKQIQSIFSNYKVHTTNLQNIFFIELQISQFFDSKNNPDIDILPGIQQLDTEKQDIFLSINDKINFIGLFIPHKKYFIHPSV